MFGHGGADMHMKVNLNGDRGTTLIGEFMDIYNAANKLRDRVADLTIHGRNYPDDFQGFRADTDERLEMIRKVEEVRRWAQNAVLMLKEQTDGK
jgi:hypothetical protein